MKERWINIKLIIVFGLLTALETASIVIFLNAPAPTYLKIIFGLIMASAAIASFIGMVYFIRECKKND